MKNRKILSAVVTAAILVGSVTPSTVFAESSWTSDPAPAANNGISAQTVGEVNVAAAANFGTITADMTYKLTADVTLSSTLNISASGVTIDLNGHTLTVPASGTGIDIASAGALTIKDDTGNGKIVNPSTKTSGYLINVVGKLTLQNGTLSSASGTQLKSYMVRILGGTFTMTGGALVNEGTYGCVKVEEATGSKFDMQGGSVSIATGGPETGDPFLDWNSTGGGSRVAIQNSGTVAISGGTVNGAFLNSGYTGGDDATFTISGTASVTGAMNIGGLWKGYETTTKLTISGGTVNFPELNWIDQYTTCTGNAKVGLVDIQNGAVTIGKIRASEDVSTTGTGGTSSPGFKIAKEVELTVSDVDTATTANKFLPEDAKLGITANGEIAKGGYAIESEIPGANGAIEIKVGDTTVAPDTLVVKGSTVTVTATPAAGYSAKGVTVTNTKDSSDVAVTQDADDANVFTFAMPEGAVEVAAEFEKKYAVTVPAKTDEGEVKTDKAKAVKGTKITLTIAPGEGYELDTLTVNGTKATVTGSTYSFDMPEKDVAVTATFKKTEIAVESVALDQTIAALTVGDTVALKATVKPDNATNKTVAWTSDTTDVATVDANGKVTAVKAGTATITATVGGKTATCKVTVTEKKVDSSVTLKAGEKKVLTTKTDAAAKTRNESAVLVIPKATAEGYAGVKVTAKGNGWEKTSGLIKTCYAKVVHTDADGVKTTVDAGSDFVIAVSVTDIPDGVTVEYSFTPANE